jgi:hypothetical protein
MHLGNGIGAPAVDGLAQRRDRIFGALPGQQRDAKQMRCPSMPGIAREHVACDTFRLARPLTLQREHARSQQGVVAAGACFGAGMAAGHRPNTMLSSVSTRKRARHEG